MPFSRKPTSLSDFVPDKKFDPSNDLLEVMCGLERVYLVFLPVRGVWVVDDELMPVTIREALESQRISFPNARGIRVDQANHGELMHFSFTHYDWIGIWTSSNVVTGIMNVKRVPHLRSTRNFGIVENH